MPSPMCVATDMSGVARGITAGQFNGQLAVKEYVWEARTGQSCVLALQYFSNLIREYAKSQYNIFYIV